MKKHSKRSKEELQEDMVIAQIQGHLQKYPLQTLCNIMLAWIRNTMKYPEGNSEIKTSLNASRSTDLSTQRKLVNRLGAGPGS